MADPPVKQEARADVKADDPDADPKVSVGSDHIDQLMSSSSVLELEAGVQVGVRLLEDLKKALNAHGAGNTQVSQWLQQIQQVEEKAKPARFVVGVVGVTGAGKSSLINAVLDEERLVPTSGIRACTASATEISYNHSDDPNELYLAEVDFISAEEWSHELKTLLDDLIDGTGNISQDCYNPDTEAGLAYSKIKAVYPKLKKAGIIKRANDSAALAREPLVSAVLGSIKRLCATSSQDLYEGLQKYIDSKEKKSSEMEYWPLIKVVRVYCKASALSTGTILVDLPGVQDSNVARAAVAENYIKMCNGLWITAGIDRAISNKAAQELLGNNFKRQMKYDGAFSGATFICTKSDDILTAEVEKSLNVEDEVEDYWQQIELLGSEIDELKVHIEGLKKQRDDVEEQYELLEARSDQWEELLEKLTNGEPVYHPLEASKKRKRKDDHYDSDEIDDSDDSGARGTSQANRDQKTSLTEDEIDNELTSIKAQKRQARKAKKSITKQIAESKKKLAEVNANEAKTQSEMRSLCIRGRNKYLKESIKRDFALGIKELDQDLAIEEDELNFDPDETIRDYEDVARSLTVFCVSARAYQKLTGRLEKDAVHIDGFASLGDTEIPQLQEYAKGLTEPGRINTCQLFLNDLKQLLNSMRLWSTGETFTAVGEDQKLDEKVLLACFTKLDAALRQAIKDCHTEIQQDLEKNIYKNFDRLVPVASKNAVKIAIGWGKPRSDGGLFWGTYKATCRRDGKFSGSFGLKDFNAELFEPINKQLAGAWERTFQKRIPSALRKFIGECKAVLEAFHKDVAINVPAAAANPAGLNMLCQQNRTHQKTLEADPNFIGAKIRESQREANRGFTPVIQQAMHPAYDTCAGESGPGTFLRMKSTMESHVNTARKAMFREACDAVKAQLDTLCADVEQWMTAPAQDLFAKLQQDYLATLVGRQAEATAAIPLVERILYEQTQPILEDADSRFAQLFFAVTGEVPSDAVGSKNKNCIARQPKDDSEPETKPVVKPEPSEDE